MTDHADTIRTPGELQAAEDAAQSTAEFYERKLAEVRAERRQAIDERDAAERELKLHVCPSDYNDLTDPPVESPDPGVDSGEEGGSLCQATTPEPPASCVRCEQAIDALHRINENAKSWHGVPSEVGQGSGAFRALRVIAEWSDAALLSLGEQP